MHRQVEAMSSVLRVLEEEYLWLEHRGMTADELSWLSGMIAGLRARLEALDEQVWRAFLGEVQNAGLDQREGTTAVASGAGGIHVA